MLLFCALSFATAALALLISRATITQWMRDASPVWLRRGLECPFCVSFWVAGLLVAVYDAPEGLSLLLSALAVWGAATAICGIAVRAEDA